MFASQGARHPICGSPYLPLREPINIDHREQIGVFSSVDRMGQQKCKNDVHTSWESNKEHSTTTMHRHRSRKNKKCIPSIKKHIRRIQRKLKEHALRVFLTLNAYVYIYIYIYQIHRTCIYVHSLYIYIYIRREGEERERERERSLSLSMYIHIHI